MKKVLLILLILTTSCQQQLEPSVENINSIFATQDFQIRLTLENGEDYRMGFLNNEMAYFSPEETVRKELSYDDVSLINTFVQEQFQSQDVMLSFTNQIEIYNDSKKVIFNTPPFEEQLFALLQTLNLPYVSTEKK